MKIKIVYTIGVFLLFGEINGQSLSMDALLDQIENNSVELKAYQLMISHRQLLYRSENNLEDPQISGYYLPFGEHQSGDYSEYEITQSIKFPSVYLKRNKLNDLRDEQLEDQYQKKRLEVLLKAKSGLINLHFLRQQKRIEEDRKMNSQKVYDQIQELFNKEQVGILDLDRAKVIWMQEQFLVDKLETEIQGQIRELEALNGGLALDLDMFKLDDLTALQTEETIWNDRLSRDPGLTELKLNEDLAVQKLKLEKALVLPDISLGYNYQGVNGNNYSGGFAGLSIPLWNSRNKVKAAQANYDYQLSSTESVKSKMFFQFSRDYNQFQLLFNTYNQYREVIAGLNSEELLFKAYSLGELSFIEYFMELKFYRDAWDKMLQMEKELQLLQSQLLKHNL